MAIEINKILQARKQNTFKQARPQEGSFDIYFANKVSLIGLTNNVIAVQILDLQ